MVWALITILWLTHNKFALCMISVINFGVTSFKSKLQLHGPNFTVFCIILTDMTLWGRFLFSFTIVYMFSKLFVNGWCWDIDNYFYFFYFFKLTSTVSPIFSFCEMEVCNFSELITSILFLLSITFGLHIN